MTPLRPVLTALAALSLAASAAAQAPATAKPAGAPAPQAQTAKPAAPAPAAPATPAPATPAPAAPAPAAPAPAAPAPAAPAAAPAAPSAAATPPVQEAYTYRAEGRRDPFLSLVGAGAESKVTSRRGDGPAGLAVSDIAVRGIMQSRGSLVAMIEGPDKKTYIVHQGDKLLDGTIKSITPQGLVVVQEVNDPLSLIRQREVRKLLRSLEDAKE
jgi:Tfp pilus assembly protein PilP